MKKIMTALTALSFFTLYSCKKDCPVPALKQTDLLENKWNWVQYVWQDFPDGANPGMAQVEPPPPNYTWEFKSNGQLELFDGAELSTVSWARVDDHSFLMPLSPLCVIKALDDHHLVFESDEPYEGGYIKHTFSFSR